MKKIIDHVRNKPEHKKHQIIWVITGSVVAALVISWVFIGSEGQDIQVGNFVQSIDQEFQAGREIFDPNLLDNINAQ